MSRLASVWQRMSRDDTPAASSAHASTDDAPSSQPAQSRGGSSSSSSVPSFIRKTLNFLNPSAARPKIEMPGSLSPELQEQIRSEARAAGQRAVAEHGGVGAGALAGKRLLTRVRVVEESGSEFGTGSDFLDDAAQVSMAMQRSLQHVASPLRPSPAERLSERFFRSRALPSDAHVPDGFYFTVGEFPEVADKGAFPSLAALRMCQPTEDLREVILVDRAVDLDLLAFEQSMLDAVLSQQPSNVLGTARIVALHVAERLGGPVAPGAYHRHAMELKARRRSMVLPLGELKVGLSRHRALLFKLVFESLGVPCLVRAGPADAEGSEWEGYPVIRFGGQELAVDLMRLPGELSVLNAPLNGTPRHAPSPAHHAHSHAASPHASPHGGDSWMGGGGSSMFGSVASFVQSPSPHAGAPLQGGGYQYAGDGADGFVGPAAHHAAQGGALNVSPQSQQALLSMLASVLAQVDPGAAQPLNGQYGKGGMVKSRSAHSFANAGQPPHSHSPVRFTAEEAPAHHPRLVPSASSAGRLEHDLEGGPAPPNAPLQGAPSGLERPALDFARPRAFANGALNPFYDISADFGPAEPLLWPFNDPAVVAHSQRAVAATRGSERAPGHRRHGDRRARAHAHAASAGGRHPAAAPHALARAPGSGHAAASRSPSPAPDFRGRQPPSPASSRRQSAAQLRVHGDDGRAGRHPAHPSAEYYPVVDARRVSNTFSDAESIDSRIIARQDSMWPFPSSVASTACSEELNSSFTDLVATSRREYDAGAARPATSPGRASRAGRAHAAASFGAGGHYHHYSGQYGGHDAAAHAASHAAMARALRASEQDAAMQRAQSNRSAQEGSFGRLGSAASEPPRESAGASHAPSQRRRGSWQGDPDCTLDITLSVSPRKSGLQHSETADPGRCTPGTPPPLELPPPASFTSAVLGSPFDAVVDDEEPWSVPSTAAPAFTFRDMVQQPDASTRGTARGGDAKLFSSLDARPDFSAAAAAAAPPLAARHREAAASLPARLGVTVSFRDMASRAPADGSASSMSPPSHALASPMESDSTHGSVRSSPFRADSGDVATQPSCDLRHSPYARDCLDDADSVAERIDLMARAFGESSPVNPVASSSAELDDPHSPSFSLPSRMALLGSAFGTEEHDEFAAPTTVLPVFGSAFGDAGGEGADAVSPSYATMGTFGSAFGGPFASTRDGTDARGSGGAEDSVWPDARAASDASPRAGFLETFSGEQSLDEAGARRGGSRGSALEAGGPSGGWSPPSPQMWRPSGAASSFTETQSGAAPSVARPLSLRTSDAQPPQAHWTWEQSASSNWLHASELSPSAVSASSFQSPFDAPSEAAAWERHDAEGDGPGPRGRLGGADAAPSGSTATTATTASATPGGPTSWPMRTVGTESSMLSMGFPDGAEAREHGASSSMASALCSSPLDPGATVQDMEKNFRMWIKDDDIRMSSEVIGRGSYGQVLLARFRTERCAVKEIVCETLSEYKACLHELLLLQELQFDKIVRFFGAVKHSDSCLWMCMEYHPFGDLRKVLHNPSHRERCRFPEAGMKLTRRLKWAKDIVAALDLLHSRNVVHRDLKPGNILISGKCDAVLADFGLSRVREASKSRLQASGPGTVSYAAPEALQHNMVSCASDMYSFGCVLWELLSLREPWAELDGAAFRIMSKVISERAVLDCADIPEAIHRQLPEVIRAIRACFSYDPGQRPRAETMWNVLDLAIERVMSAEK